ncbi:MAG: hypothetical protein ACPIA2_17880 [Mariniblastus sp.]
MGTQLSRPGDAGRYPANTKSFLSRQIRMRCTTIEIAAKQMRVHDLPAFFVDVLYNHHRKYGRDLDIYFEPPREFFRLVNERPEDFPFVDSLIPILEFNYECFVCYIPPPHDIFIDHSIERLPSEYHVLAKTHDEFAGYQLERLWEPEFSIEDLRVSADLLGYANFDSFLSQLRR